MGVEHYLNHSPIHHHTIIHQQGQHHDLPDDHPVDPNHHHEDGSASTMLLRSMTTTTSTTRPSGGYHRPLPPGGSGNNNHHDDYGCHYLRDFIRRHQRRRYYSYQTTSWITTFQTILVIFILYIFFRFHKSQWERLQQRRIIMLQRSSNNQNGNHPLLSLRGIVSNTNEHDPVVTKTLRQQWITNTTISFNADGAAQHAEHCIIVAGHSVTISGHLEDANIDEHDWMMLEYQKHRGLPNAIMAHIQKGIEVASNDPSALLIFSGGQTRANTGPESEGASYYRVADAMQLWTTTSSSSSHDPTTTTEGIPDHNHTNNMTTTLTTNNVRARTITEEYATDSFQNLLYSICRFYEITQRYPTKITMISFTFKEYRFRQMHAMAIRYPIEQFDYIGIDPPASTGFDIHLSTQGEYDNSIQPFEVDPYGCHSEALQQKRIERNPFFRTSPYPLSCPDMKELFEYCGPDIISPGKVPWNHHVTP